MEPIYTFLHLYIKEINIAINTMGRCDQIWKRDHFFQNICDLFCEQTTVKTSQTSQFCINTVAIYA